MCPVVIEDIFALRVTLGIQRGNSDHLPVFLGGQVSRLPACAGANGPAVFKRFHKPVGRERIEGPPVRLLWASAGIPISLRYCRQIGVSINVYGVVSHD